MSVPVKSNVSRSWTVSSFRPNATLLPAERSLASATTSLAGNLRARRIASVASPTAPVAPTTATLNCRSLTSVLFEFAALPAMPEHLVHQHQRHHRLGDRCRADADAGIVATLGR